jgi:hypothetical protein
VGQLPSRLTVSLTPTEDCLCTFYITASNTHLFFYFGAATLGSVVVFFGVAHANGARFSFDINNGPSQSCTCWLNANSSVWHFRVELCSLTGLNELAQHTLTITHTDVSGSWLKLDYLE